MDIQTLIFSPSKYKDKTGDNCVKLEVGVDGVKRLTLSYNPLNKDDGQWMRHCYVVMDDGSYFRIFRPFMFQYIDQNTNQLTEDPSALFIEGIGLVPWKRTYKKYHHKEE